MKIKSVLVAVMLITSGIVMAPAQAAQKPVLESFTFTPDVVEILGAETSVTFELIVSHPDGIETTNTYLTLTSPQNDTAGTTLTRTDSPRNASLTKVTFKGTLVLPRGIVPGVYAVSSSSVKSVLNAGYQSDSGTLVSKKIRSLVGGEAGLLVRANGDLNLSYKTFEGPSFDKTIERDFVDVEKYRNAGLPIWKVGEFFDLTKYYEAKVPSLPIQISTSTPSICTSDEKIMKFISTGECTFKVLTPKTKDYVAYSQSFTATITSARIKPQLVINKISDQTTVGLPKAVKTDAVYGALGDFAFPTSTTPSVCYVTDFYVHLLAGGRCTLTYQTIATTQFLASDVYTTSFEVLKDGQPVVVPTPTPTPTTNPVVKKTIKCVKGKKSVSKTGVSPKCPKGYKLKKK
ncbi:unannotated protein [freshwater metagenome]|uniref:Unannotated protein n=1 Tax=freshwater metagenome TaxID=449393 RepID=A0A6J7HQ29_9ZZZZ|nr:hypothetical protein [Actinomycetota bacterium]